MPQVNRGVLYALAAAVLFGASTPLAKLLTGTVSPVMLAGLLYAGSGVGLLGAFALGGAARRATEAPLRATDVPALALATAAGGVLAPILLLYGLRLTTAAAASLLLNLEAVFTALLAMLVFREHVGRRVVAGMVAIVAAGVLLSWRGTGIEANVGDLAIGGACLAWAADNNVTRRISAADPLAVAGIKGAIAGGVNIALARLGGAAVPGAATIALAGALGLAGYGASLTLYVLALRSLGAARTGSYFSVAPFVGAALSLVGLRETVGTAFWIAAGLMGFGLWLQLTERHGHEHRHEALAHSHAHVHDEHHRHAHDFPWQGSGPHSHHHVHEVLVHRHPHFPDIHHRHRH